MTGRITMVVGLVVLWVLLWGGLSVPNVASGVLVAVALLVVFPLPRGEGVGGVPFRPLALLRLGGYFVEQLLVSNLQLSRAILTPDARLRTQVVACPLGSGSERVLAVVANVLALTPGIMPVEVVSSPPTVTVHVLRSSAEGARASVARLERLVVAAVGPEAAR